MAIDGDARAQWHVGAARIWFDARCRLIYQGPVSHLALPRPDLARVVPFVVASLLCACSVTEPMRGGWEYDPATSFVGMRSYAWIPGPQRRTGDSRVDDSWQDRRIRQAIDRQLVAQGFVAAPPEQADFWVGYHVRLTDKVATSTANTYYGYNRGQSGGDAGLYAGWFRSGAQSTYQRRQDAGTLTVFIEAPATQQPIWQGFARAGIEPSDDRETRDQRLAKAVVMILEKFPPTATSPQSTRTSAE